MTNAQRRALNRMAEMNSPSNESKLEPTSNAFCPHEAGAYYLVTVGTVSKIIQRLTMEMEPPVHTYAIATIHFEKDPDTGKWIWFDGKEKL
ncbi:MAG: hypothetical protein Q8M60_05155, partial [Methylotenera sp.]|nr:hypothetical protein [Methylotenera sp.]MDP3210937.1 hypothetical protein [Methylotenera sp.]